MFVLALEKMVSVYTQPFCFDCKTTTTVLLAILGPVPMWVECAWNPYTPPLGGYRTLRCYCVCVYVCVCGGGGTTRDTKPGIVLHGHRNSRNTPSCITMHAIIDLCCDRSHGSIGSRAPQVFWATTLLHPLLIVKATHTPISRHKHLSMSLLAVIQNHS